MYLAPSVSWTDASTALVISLVLMLMPDRVVGTLRRFLEKKAGVLLLQALFLTGSCASNRLPGCRQLYGDHRVDLVQVITYAKSPADSAQVLIHVDSLLHLLNRPWLETSPPMLQASSGRGCAKRPASTSFPWRRRVGSNDLAWSSSSSAKSANAWLVLAPEHFSSLSVKVLSERTRPISSLAAGPHSAAYYRYCRECATRVVVSVLPSSVTTRRGRTFRTSRRYLFPLPCSLPAML